MCIVSRQSTADCLEHGLLDQYHLEARTLFAMQGIVKGWAVEPRSKYVVQSGY